MSIKKKSTHNSRAEAERRTGPVNRRIGMADSRGEKIEQRVGMPERRVTTKDAEIAVVTSSGEYTGTINLNSAPERIERTSDFFTKGNQSFITLYNAIRMGQSGKVIFINIKDIAVVLPKDDIFPDRPELRKDASITIKLKYGLGTIKGKVNLMGESRQVDRISDLLNYPGKKWLVVYNAEYRARFTNAALINLEFISSVEG